MQSFLQDVRYALRQLRSAPGFAVVAVLSLALGIGATTAVFSIVYVVLIHPYPFRDWERLAVLSVRDQSGNSRCCMPVTGGQLKQLREAAPVEEVVAFDQWNLTTTDADLPEDVNAIYFTTNVINYFGIPPILGRGFIPTDAPEGQDPQPVVILSYPFWQRRFGADPNIVGRNLQLSHINYKIVGVMSPRQNWGQADVYLPLKIRRDPDVRLSTSIRLKPGVTIAMASQLLQPLLAEFAKETPGNFPPGFRADIRLLSSFIAATLGPTLYLLFGAVCLLLLIGCLNVSILLMARGTRRQYELAVRAALGAARARVARQLLTESLILAVLGGILGIGLAYLGQKLLVQQLPSYLTVRKSWIHINLPVLAFSLAATLLAVVFFGLLPALQFSRRELTQVMKLGVQRVAAGWGKQTRNALIAGQIALSLMLLAAAGTSIHTFLRLMHTDLGYDPHNAASLGIPVHQNTYGTWEERSAYFDRLQQKIASTPDVIGVALSIGAIPPSNGWNTSFEVLGQNVLGDQQLRANFVSHEYFGVLHIALRRGRLWDRGESLRGAHLAVINQTAARLYFAQGDAIGKQIRLPKLLASPPTLVGAPEGDQWLEIVGIVADSVNDGLRNPVKPGVYLPYTFRMPMFTQILVKTRTNPLSLLRTFRAQVQAVDSEQQIMNDATNLEEWIARGDDWQREHLVAILFGAFSVITLVLAGIGLYSVVSYTVAQRTSEFALRMALGAQRSDVLINLTLATARVVVAGVGVGAGLYLLINRAVAHWAYAPSSNPWILLLVTPLLMCVAGLACYVPARRAMALDPMKALRHE